MATPQPSKAQPKIVHKLVVRTALFLGTFAIVMTGLRWIQSRQGDFDNGGESKGLIAAIRRENNGQQIVLISPDGKVKATTSWKDGVTDREPAWSPDGKFLYFCSDRKDETFHIFRWNPTGDDAEERTVGRISRSNPTFPPISLPEGMLIVAGGTVRELDPRSKKTPQVLPPPNAEITNSGEGDETGTDGAFASLYGSLGKSFRVARYFPDRRFVAAIMRREQGELLMIQDLEPKDGKVAKPQTVGAGDHIDFDITPDGKLVYSIQGFQWPDLKEVPPEFIKNNRITTPFRHIVAISDPLKERQVSVVVISENDKVAFGAPKVSPDGSRLILAQGLIEEGTLSPKGFLIMPCAERGIQTASPLVEGEVYEPSWTIDGQQIVYAKRANGSRTLYRIGVDGSKETAITDGKADYSLPVPSPMTK